MLEVRRLRDANAGLARESTPARDRDQGCERAGCAGERKRRGGPDGVHDHARDRGAAAGLQVAVELTDGDDERAIRAQARSRRVEIETMGDFRPAAAGSPPALVLGYAQMPEPTIRAGVRELAEAVHAARRDQAPQRGGHK